MKKAVYLHGFLSSPQAYKASLCRVYLAKHFPDLEFDVPALPNKPSEALPFIKQYFEQLQQTEYSQVWVLGSSLGGFYAQWVSQNFGHKAILINPLVYGASRMEFYDSSKVGLHTNPYSREQFAIDQQDFLAMQSVEQARSPSMTPSHLMVFLQMADEVLDAREASLFYDQSICVIEPGGDHQYQGFERYLELVFTWLSKQG